MAGKRRPSYSVLTRRDLCCHSGHELAEKDVGGFQASRGGGAARRLGWALLGRELLRELTPPFAGRLWLVWPCEGDVRACPLRFERMF